MGPACAKAHDTTGVSPACGFWPSSRKRERAEAATEALSTETELAGGPAHRCEATAFWGGGGAKGPAHLQCSFGQPGAAREEAREHCQRRR